MVLIWNDDDDDDDDDDDGGGSGSGTMQENEWVDCINLLVFSLGYSVFCLTVLPVDWSASGTSRSIQLFLKAHAILALARARCPGSMLWKSKESERLRWSHVSLENDSSHTLQYLLSYSPTHPQRSNAPISNPNAEESSNQMPEGHLLPKIRTTTAESNHDPKTNVQTELEHPRHFLRFQ